jgi:glycine reductase complex component B subunit gamma
VVKVVHYLNQFFAGLGGEEAARTAPHRLDGPVGPGLLLGLPISATLTCGDDFFGEREDEAIAKLLRLLAAEDPDVLVLGPAFASGRYGYACGTLAREAARLGVPGVAGLHPENPGIAAGEGEPYIVPTSAGVRGMRDALGRMASLAHRLATGEKLGPPEAEGYLPRGLRRNELAAETAGARAVELLLAKLGGDTRTEVAAAFDAVAPPPPVAALSRALLALVTEAGCVPIGNPDGFPSVRANSWARYPLDGRQSLESGAYESIHGGFDVTQANANPNRLVPLDVVRALEKEGRIGRVHDFFYVTMGNGTPVASATRIGSEIAAELRETGVEAVLLSGT